MSIHDKIIAVLKPRERYCFGDICKVLKVKDNKVNEYYRAWQDLKTNGRLQIMESGMYRINL